MAIGWEGQKVRLVPLDREKHFDHCVEWLNDPVVTEWTLVGDMPLTRLAEEKYFDQAMAGSATDISFAIETLAGEHIGQTGIHQIDCRNGTAKTGTIIGRRDHWGRGYGTDVVAARARYCFQVLGLRLLLTEVMAENVASFKALQKCGYREFGRIPQRYWKRGAYRDLILLMLDRASWAAKQPPP